MKTYKPGEKHRQVLVNLANVLMGQIISIKASNCIHSNRIQVIDTFPIQFVFWRPSGWAA